MALGWKPDREASTVSQKNTRRLWRSPRRNPEAFPTSGPIFPESFPRGPKIETIKSRLKFSILRAQRLTMKIALRNWNFQARLKCSSEPPTEHLFVWGIQNFEIEILKRDWIFQASRLKNSLSLEMFNLDFQNSPQKSGFGGRLAWNFQSRLKI